MLLTQELILLTLAPENTLGQSARKKLPDIYFDLIDRAYLDLDESFHPTRKERQAGPLDIIARHPPYDKISEVGTGLRWIRNKRADEQG